VGKRPRLATRILNVVDRDSDFLAHLSNDSAFQSLAWFDESGETAVHRCSELNPASEQRLLIGTVLASGDEGDHRRCESRKTQQSTARTAHCPLTVGLLRSLSTTSAESVSPSPFDDLDRTTGDEPLVFTRSSEIRVEIECSPIGGIVPMGNVDTPTGCTVEDPEEMGVETRVGRSVVLPHAGFDHVEISV